LQQLPKKCSRRPNESWDKWNGPDSIADKFEWLRSCPACRMPTSIAVRAGMQVTIISTARLSSFSTPFGKTEDYFLRRVRPEKDIEGLTVENTGRMALNIKTVDEEEKYEGVVPCTAKAILTLLNQHHSIRDMFPAT
jgi:hypothetical protein